MSDELKVSAGLICELASGAEIVKRFHATLDVTGDSQIYNVQDVGTSEETLAKGDIATIGYMIYYNRDSTNYIELGKSTGVYHIKVRAGGIGILEWDGATDVYAKANSSSCDLEYVLVEA